MINSQFKLLTESLGFYSAKQIVQYLKQFQNFQTLAERPVDYWLKGKRNNNYDIPQDVVMIFLNLLEFQKKLKSKINESKSNYNHIFKMSENMWMLHPELTGLPTTFLNQTVISMGLYLDYYENTQI